MSSSDSFFEKVPGKAEGVIQYLFKNYDKVGKDLMGKMNSAVNIMWITARAKRPKISTQQAKSSATRYFRRDSNGKRKEYRVSDPAAKLGVPVDTGILQASIKKEVNDRKNGKIIGRIYVDGVKYAKYMEFGTSNIQARPFMRPAIDLNKERIKNLFKKPIKK